MRRNRTEKKGTDMRRELGRRPTIVDTGKKPRVYMCNLRKQETVSGYITCQTLKYRKLQGYIEMCVKQQSREHTRKIEYSYLKLFLK
jgi:hypothetical protein